MIALNKYFKKETKEDYKEIYSNVTDDIASALGEFFSDKPMFDENNFNIFFYDDYLLNTNSYKDVIPTLYVEINQIENYKTDIRQRKKIFHKKNKVDEINVPQLHLTLEDIKLGLFEILAKRYDKNTLLWVNKFSFNLSFNYTTEDGKNDTYFFKVIPCLTFYNKNKQHGLMYFNESQNDICIEYPDLSIKNFKLKDKATNGGYTQSIIMLKNIYMDMDPETKNLPFDVFETIMYNVPNQFLQKDTLANSIQEIINFLRNKSMKDFITIDEQDSAFISPYRSVSVLYIKHVIKLFEKFVLKEK